MRYWKGALIIGTLCISIVQLGTPPVQAAVPTMIQYQGYLEKGGSPGNGTYDLTFRLYTVPSGGAAIWEELHTGVPATDGLFKVNLGSITPLSSDFFDSPELYLGISIFEDPESTPRQRILAVAFAMRVATVDGAEGGNINSTLSIGSGHTVNGSSGIVAGQTNELTGSEAAIIAGSGNSVSGDNSFVGGGSSNDVSAINSAITSGSNNSVISGYSAIGTGHHNEVLGANMFIGGGAYNFATGDNSFIGSGGDLDAGNTVSGDFAAVVAGTGNEASGLRTFIGSGNDNLAVGQNAGVVGGNENNAQGAHAFVGGGSRNEALSSFSSVTAGVFNTASGYLSSVAAGGNNHASGQFSFVGGGGGDTAPDSNLAAGDWSSIGGGHRNYATGEAASIPGGYDNEAAGNFSFAAGRQSKALHNGSFVWADASGTDFETTAPDQFLVRADGGVGVNTNSVESTLQLHTLNTGDPTLYFENGDKDIAWASGHTLQLGMWDGVKFNERVRIESNGDVGIGTTTPSEKLHVVGGICATGKIGACSDGRFKTNIHDIESPLHLIRYLHGIKYNWKREEFPEWEFSDDEQLGFVAQDVVDVLPEVVSQGDDGYYSIDYGKLTPLLVEALKEMNSELEHQKEIISALQRRISRIEKND